MDNEKNISNTKVKTKKSKFKKIFLTTLFVLLNVGVIAYTAYSEFFKEKPKPYTFNFGFESIYFLICALLCLLLAELIEALKYRSISNVIGEPASLKHCIQVVFLGKYYDSITPSGTGGQPFQIYYLHKNGYSSGASATLTLMGFFTFQIGFVVVAILALVFNAKVVQIPSVIVLASIGLFTYSIVPAFIILFAKSSKTAIKIIMFFARILHKLHIIKDIDRASNSIISSLQAYHDSMIKVTSNRFALTKMLLMSVVTRILICSIPYFVLLAFNGTGSYFDILCITFIIYSAITIIPTPGNSGAAEASFYLIFSNLDTGGVFWSMLVWRFICYYLYIFVGIGIYIYNAIKARIEKKKKQNDIPQEIESDTNV